MLAYVGDAVYELIVREQIAEQNHTDVSKAHKSAVTHVSAEAQSKAMRAMVASGFVTAEEEAVFKRARNHRSMSKPQHADPRDYKVATGFEALIGWLHLEGNVERAREIALEAIRLTSE